MINKTIQGIHGILNNMKEKKNTYCVSEIDNISKISYFKNNGGFSRVAESIMLQDAFREKISYTNSYSNIGELPNPKRMNNHRRPYSFFSEEQAKDFDRVIIENQMDEESMLEINIGETGEFILNQFIHVYLDIDGFCVINEENKSIAHFLFSTYGSCELYRTSSNSVSKRKRASKKNIIKHSVVSFNAYEPFIVERIIEAISSHIFKGKSQYMYDILSTLGKDSGFYIMMESVIISYFVRSRESKIYKSYYNEISDNSISISTDTKTLGTVEINKNSIHLYHNTPSKCMYVEFKKPTKELFDDFSNSVCTYLGLMDRRNFKYSIMNMYNNIYKDFDYNSTDTDGKWYINHKNFDGEYAYKLIKENNKFYL